MTFSYNDYTNLFLTKEEQEEYLATARPFNNALVEKALKKRLEEDPDYEVFLPLVYYKFNKGTSKNVTLEPHNYFISNRGNIIRKLSKGYKLLKRNLNSSWYLQFIINTGKTSTSFVIHRAVGSVFVEIPNELLKNNNAHDLMVNHKDGIKTNPKSTNLEWTTPQQNALHALENGITPIGLQNTQTKPLKGTVLRGSFKGHEFIIFGKTQLKEYGFDQAATSNAVSGNIKSHGNCSWAFATIEEQQQLPNGLTDDILEEIRAINPWSKFIIIGTCLITGNVVRSIGYDKLIKLGFSKSGIENVFGGYSTKHKNYSWARELID